MNREPKQLEKGIIVVQFEENHRQVDNLMGQQFTMAETTAYFESYRHVLKGLQEIRAEHMPFQRYVIDCERKVRVPAYLRRLEGAVYDLRPLVDTESIIKDPSRLEEILGNDDDDDDVPVVFSERSKEAEAVRILEGDSWPPADLLHLDESQFQAIRTALTKEFVITQGPPGTGKTYIGLKIVKALLHNKDVWTINPDTGRRDSRPMLIVCYTNHALDQFLEGIVSFYKGDVVRIGSRSNSEILKPYNLHNFRQRFRHEKKIPVQVFKGRREARFEMESVMADIRKVSAEIQIATTNIMAEDFLRQYMGENHYQTLIQQFEMMLQVYPEAREAFQRGHSVIVEWLGLGNLAPIVEMEAAMIGEVAPDENDLIDAEDEVDAIQANRQIDNRDDLDVDDEIDLLINELADEHIELSRKERAEMRVKLATTAQQRFVAMDVSALDDKPKGVHDGEWQQQKRERKKQKKNIQRHLALNQQMTEEEAEAIHDIWQIPMDSRWRLYSLWMKRYQEFQLAKIKDKEDEFEQAAARHREALMQEDKEIMRHSTIIGMTTTAAARYQRILQEILPKIVVVEEAAEVLEAHIITTLSHGCEHLILIGDHKQLKPNPTVYKLATDYKLDVSLFERMVRNGIHCDCLALQHRMRPEIAELVKPIYPELRNHPDVEKYESIKGISSNVFFINHSHHESNDEDLRSHSNMHEARYMVALCKYLFKQGYAPEQITVLTLYSGQLFCFKNMMPKAQFEGVKLTVVDNYQGEENDIILLSLVRSNNEDSIGFLSIENRVCVALSRAKKGFYVIGNFELLQRRSKLWNEVVIEMKQKKRFGEGLVLQCQLHKDEKPITAVDDNDFEKAPEGGCDKRCGCRLECGHLCERYCHPLDRDHVSEMSRCKKRCDKVICANKHRCRLTCGKKCQPCKELIQKTIPRCGHAQNVPCSMPPVDFTCQEACGQMLSCGHKCQTKCGLAHTTDCKMTVEKTWPCGHKGRVLCYQKDKALCPEPCDAFLGCEHRCRGTCGQCFQGRLHVACRNDCSRILVCGHECLDKCNQCPPCTRPCENSCQHSKCPKRCGELCAPCREPCNWRCEHYRCTNLCSEPCNRPPCDQPCRKRLKCGHDCIGLCGEPCPTDCRVCDRQKVTEIFFGDEDEPGARFVRLQDCRQRCIFEVDGLDTYMKTKADERGEVKLKECPKCRTAIRTTTRYREIVNKTLADIEKVKETVLSNKKRLRDLEKDINEGITNISNGEMRVAFKRRLGKMSEPRAENALAAMLNQLRFSEKLQKQRDAWKELKGVEFEGERERGLLALNNFEQWLVEERSIFTDQEIDDANMEFDRLKALLMILMYQQRAKKTGKQLDFALKAKVREAEKCLNGSAKYTETVRITVEQCLEQLAKVVPLTGLMISEEERVMIVQAMQLPIGHWFKCPNGK